MNYDRCVIVSRHPRPGEDMNCARSMPPAPSSMSLRDRFERRAVPSDNGCWEWVGAHHNAGYGQLRINGRAYYAHRISYELNIGPIPDGLHIDHLCRNRGCVNPAHLEAVTPQENMLRGVAPAAATCRSNKCIRGHDLAVYGYTRKNAKGRNCRACQNLRQNARRRLEAK